MIAQKVLRRLRLFQPAKFGQYLLDSSKKSEVQNLYPGDLADIFFGPKRLLVHKWLHYLEPYDRYFSKYRGQQLSFLEIGVSKGGSLEMWRSYFGPDATIFGVDIDPACAAFEAPGTKVRIGSQADEAFLKGIVAEMGAPDIILDDGSHVSKHQDVSFRTLFPLLKDGGLYVIEDLHTAYWTKWDGGYKRRGTGIELVKTLIDDMHAWYHDRPELMAPKDEILGIHMYDSLVFIEKGKKPQPAHIQIPGTI